MILQSIGTRQYSSPPSFFPLVFRPCNPVFLRLVCISSLDGTKGVLEIKDIEGSREVDSIWLRSQGFNVFRDRGRGIDDSCGRT